MTVIITLGFFSFINLVYHTHNVTNIVFRLCRVVLMGPIGPKRDVCGW